MHDWNRFRNLFGMGLLAVLPLEVTAKELDERPLAIQAERVFPEIRFRRPIVVTHAPDGSDRLFVASQLGEIQVFESPRTQQPGRVFLDLEPRVTYQDMQNEEGLLGLAFHPRFAENGEFFVYYSTKESPNTSVISRFRVSEEDPNRADPESEQPLLVIPQPYWNHNGGGLLFGPNGYLYIALGDGGSANDPHGNGQNLGTLLGSLLRIDVDRRDEGRPYAIPRDNPFRDTAGARPEIYAYGLRNVWGMAIDPVNNLHYAADVGQDRWEEINLIVRGGNYGWSLREGRHQFGSEGSGPREDLIEPIWEYSHAVGKSITGGVVYRGRKLPELEGCFLYADYITGGMWALKYDPDGQRVVANRPLAVPPLPVIAFGLDAEGEVYFSDTFGMVYRLEPATPEPTR
jgi:glucose/arabinose dehydrogenase